MKHLFYFLTVLIVISCGNVDEAVDKIIITEKDQDPWSFEEIEGFILDEFPEAYGQFLNVSFSRHEDRIIPQQATFMIPTKYFTEGKLNQEICDKKTRNVITKMGGEPGNCESCTIGDSSEYAFHNWEDKTVTKVTIDFAIGC